MFVRLCTRGVCMRVCARVCVCVACVALHAFPHLIPTLSNFLTLLLHPPHSPPSSPYLSIPPTALRADAINACFSLHTVDAILSALKRLADSATPSSTHAPPGTTTTTTTSTTNPSSGDTTSSSSATTDNTTTTSSDSSSSRSHLFPAELATPENARWAAETHATLLGCSPSSLHATLRSMREGRQQSLARCLQREYRLSVRALMCTATNDLYEGIRARLVDKDGAPKVSPCSSW